MATPRKAELSAAQGFGPDARLVELTLVEEERVGFTGGQYLIVDTGWMQPTGRTAKRAYSILSSDRAQARLWLAVRRVPDGLASSYLLDLPLGAPVTFSGPWGKLRPAGARPLLVATDTGITAALGLANASALADAAVRILWLAPSADYFVPLGEVRARVPRGVELEFQLAPPVRHVERLGVVRAALARARAAHRADAVYLLGDGGVAVPLAEELLAAGVPVQTEVFFNRPPKAAPGA